MKLDWRIESVFEGIAPSANGFPPAKRDEKDFFCPRGSAQPLEKAQNGQGNPRKTRRFSLIYFAGAWVDFGGFG
jgi:hypothetical protein